MRYLKFWGTRGSVSVSGRDHVVYGGETSCIEFQDGSTTLVLDAGTGIRALGKSLLERKVRHISLFIGHCHWDHISGFPFFAPLYQAGTHIDIYGPPSSTRNLRELFQGIFAGDYFPVKLEEMRAQLLFHDLAPGARLSVGAFTVETAAAHHPGHALCFKVSTPHQTIGYATDNEFLLDWHEETDSPPPTHLQPYRTLLDFFRRCDLLIHEAQYTREQYRTKVGWGHSSMHNAALLLKLTEAKEWIVTHHDPDDTDTWLDEKLSLQQRIASALGLKIPVRFAHDGLTLDLK